MFPARSTAASVGLSTPCCEHSAVCAKPRPRPFIGVASTQVHEADMETQPPPHIDMLVREDEGVAFWCPKGAPSWRPG